MYNKRSKQEHIVTVEGQVASNQLDLIKLMALDHLCIVALPKFMVKNEIKKGKLVACLDNYSFIQNPFYIVYPKRDLLPLKLKLFIDFVKKQISDQ